MRIPLILFVVAFPLIASAGPDSAPRCDFGETRSSESAIKMYGPFRDGDTILQTLCRANYLDQDIDVYLQFARGASYHGGLRASNNFYPAELWSDLLQEAFLREDLIKYPTAHDLLETKRNGVRQLAALGLQKSDKRAGEVVFVEDFRVRVESIDIGGLEFNAILTFFSNPGLLFDSGGRWVGSDLSVVFPRPTRFCRGRTEEMPLCGQIGNEVHGYMPYMLSRVELTAEGTEVGLLEGKVRNAIHEKYKDFLVEEKGAAENKQDQFWFYKDNDRSLEVQSVGSEGRITLIYASHHSAKGSSYQQVYINFKKAMSKAEDSLIEGAGSSGMSGL